MSDRDELALTVRIHSYAIPRCPDCPKGKHPALTCAEAEALAASMRTFIDAQTAWAIGVADALPDTFKGEQR